MDGPLDPETDGTALEVIGEDGIAYAAKIAEFRAGLKEPDRMPNEPGEAD